MKLYLFSLQIGHLNLKVSKSQILFPLQTLISLILNKCTSYSKIIKAKLKENSEQKLREVIKETIRGILSEKTTTFQMGTPDMKKVDMLLKKGKFKGLNMKAKGPKFTLTVPKKMEDKVLSYLIQKKRVFI